MNLLTLLRLQKKKKKGVICEAHSDDSQQAVDLEFDTLLYALKPLKENIKRLEAGLCKSRNGQGIASSSCKRRKVRFAELTQCLQIFHLKVPVTMHHFMIPSWPKKHQHDFAKSLSLYFRSNIHSFQCRFVQLILSYNQHGKCKFKTAIKRLTKFCWS